MALTIRKMYYVARKTIVVEGVEIKEGNKVEAIRDYNGFYINLHKPVKMKEKEFLDAFTLIH